MLSAGLNIVGFSWITSPAATELEIIVLDWLAKALKLPEDFYSTGKCLDYCVPLSCCSGKPTGCHLFARVSDDGMDYNSFKFINFFIILQF